MCIRVVLVDSHPVVRCGLKEMLSVDGDIQVVAEGADYGELRQALRTHRCDVVVLDVDLPGRSGLDALRNLCDLEPAPRTVVFSSYPEDPYAVRAIRAGALAYVGKSASRDAIVAAVRTAASGRRYLTPEVALALAESVADHSGDGHDALSDREIQTLELIAEGHKLSEIAQRLMLSPKTVSVYRARVMQKLHLTSNAQLATYAMRAGLLHDRPESGIEPDRPGERAHALPSAIRFPRDLPAKVHALRGACQAAPARARVRIAVPA